MLSVDTNLVVRMLTNDDRAQSLAAREIFSSEPVWISKTVLLEAEWVLRSSYDYKPEAVRDGFVSLLGLPTVTVEHAVAVAQALALNSEGMDFADALHLASRPEGAGFVTFDKQLVKCAHRAGVTDIALAG